MGGFAGPPEKSTMKLVVPKRKVPALVRLANSTILEGFLYLGVAGRRGTPESVADRLNDSTEKYIPFATNDRHLFMNKSFVVSAKIALAEGGIGERQPSQEGERQEFRLRFHFLDGTAVTGVAAAAMPYGRERALDFLNLRAARFVDVLEEDHILLVNMDFVVAINEILAQDLEAEPWTPMPAGR